MNPSSDSSHRLEGIAARLQSIQDNEKEKKDVLGKSVSFSHFFVSPSSSWSGIALDL